MPTYLDLERWPRRAAFEFYKDFDSPFFGVTVELDVTRLRALCRERELSFNLATQFLAMRASNAYEPFRMRLEEDGRVAIYEVVHPSSTHLVDGEKLLVVTHDYADDFGDYCDLVAEARERAKARTTYLDEASMRPDTVHLSTLPWVTFTNVTHARHLSGDRGSEPKVVLGRYHKVGDDLHIPVSVECHHALMDGLHVSTWLGRLQGLFDEPAKHLG